MMTDHDPETRTVTHLAGEAILFDGRQRQRCAWCGYVIEDQDLAHVAVMLNEDGSTPEYPHWPPGAFLRTTTNGGFTGTHIVSDEELAYEPDEVCEEHRASVRVPDDCCMRLPAEMTLAVEGQREVELSDG
jgi:hypothetical protein